MDENSKLQNAAVLQQPKTAEKKPNETGSISVEAHVKIFDPKSKEVYVEKRA